MSKIPSRTVEVLLDADSMSFLMAQEAGAAEFDFGSVRQRFLEHIKPTLGRELQNDRGSLLMRFAASVVSGAMRLIRRDG